MKSLNPHICNYLDVFDSIKSGKQKIRKQILSNLRNTVNARYLSYQAATNALHTIQIQTYVDADEEALLHCYDSETNALSELKSGIKEAQAADLVSLCQYCGVDSAPTFDHFLPKDVFPEFAVLAINLVPCCYKCNQTKKANWTNGTHCLVFNLYFDQLPMERVLFCGLSYGTPSTPNVTFTLRKPANMSAVDFQRVDSHYTTLKLLSKFDECANTFISETRNELRELNPRDRALMVRLLGNKVSGLANALGVNCWKVAVAEAMQASTEFLDSCERP
jgi:5-methylcytosine-specific restriction endonuclease McrA